MHRPQPLPPRRPPSPGDIKKRKAMEARFGGKIGGTGPRKPSTISKSSQMASARKSILAARAKRAAPKSGTRTTGTANALTRSGGKRSSTGRAALIRAASERSRNRNFTTGKVSGVRTNGKAKSGGLTAFQTAAKKFRSTHKPVPGKFVR